MVDKSELDQIFEILNGKVTFSDHFLVSGSNDVIYLINCDTGKTERKLARNKEPKICHIPRSRIGKDPFLLIGNWKLLDNQVRIWNLKSGVTDSLVLSPGHYGPITLISPSESLVALISAPSNGSGSKIEILCLEDKSLVLLKEFENKVSTILNLAPDEIAIGFSSAQVSVFNWRKKEVRLQINASKFEDADSTDHGKRVRQLVLFPNSQLAVRTAHALTFWNSITGEFIRNFGTEYNWYYMSKVFPFNDDKVLMIQDEVAVVDPDKLAVSQGGIRLTDLDGKAICSYPFSFSSDMDLIVNCKGEKKLVLDQTDFLGVYHVTETEIKLEKQYKRSVYGTVLYLPASSFSLEVRVLKWLLIRRLQEVIPKVLIEEVFSFFL